jgi:hypothetical protein
MSKIVSHLGSKQLKQCRYVNKGNELICNIFAQPCTDHCSDGPCFCGSFVHVMIHLITLIFLQQFLILFIPTMNLCTRR